MSADDNLSCLGIPKAAKFCVAQVPSQQKAETKLQARHLEVPCWLSSSEKKIPGGGVEFSLRIYPNKRDDTQLASLEITMVFLGESSNSMEHGFHS